MKKLDKGIKFQLGYLTWASFCIALLCVVGVTEIWGYESNDDRTLATIAGGFYGIFSPYTIYNNILQGYFLSRLYIVFSYVNWTTIYYLSLILISYFLIGCACIRKYGSYIGVALGSAFVGTTGVTIVCRMNYSKTGALAFMAGFFLTMTVLDKKGSRTKYDQILLIFSAFISILGGLVRVDSTIALVPFFFIGILYLYFKYKKSMEKIIPLVIVGIILLLCWTFHYIVYMSNPIWREYFDYSTKVQNIIDYGVPSYEEHKTQYKELGLSENDLQCLNGWNYMDDQVFNQEVLSEILVIQSKDKDSLIDVLINLLKLLWDYKIYIIMITVLVAGVSVERELKKCCFASLIMLICLLELSYLSFKGRCIERACIIPLIASLICAMIIYEKKNNKRVAVILLIFCSFCGIASNVSTIERYQTPFKGIAIGLYQELSEQQDCLFVWNQLVDSSVCGLGFSPLDNFPKGGHRNSVMLGGWIARAPYISDISGNYGNENNVFELLAENPRVYYVSTEGIYCDVIEKYIQEHYNPKARCVQVGEILGFGIYSFNELFIGE